MAVEMIFDEWMLTAIIITTYFYGWKFLDQLRGYKY